MSAVLILDSNTISYYFRSDPQVVPRLQFLRPSDLGVPVIVEYDLRYGLRGTGLLPFQATIYRVSLCKLAQYAVYF